MFPNGEFIAVTRNMPMVYVSEAKSKIFLYSLSRQGKIKAVKPIRIGIARKM